MEYHFEQNQGFSPKGISYEQPLTLKQVARPSIFGDPDFFWRRQGHIILIPEIFFGGGAGYLNTNINTIGSRCLFPPWVVLPTQGVGSWVCFARWSRIFTT